MIDEQAILTAERLRDDLVEFRRRLRKRYPKALSQVGSEKDRNDAARLAETWLVELSRNWQLGTAIGSAALGDLNVQFQRLLTFSEHATVRSKYDGAIKNIVDNYATKVVLPLKQSRGRNVTTPELVIPVTTIVSSAFVGQSFVKNDARVNQCVAKTLQALGVKVVTGEKPVADSVSEKVKRLIEDQSIFVGIFTRRDKVARKNEWTTSAWVIDEKAYALGRRRPLILIKEEGVGSIGGIQGDYEYLEFSRDSLDTLAIGLIQLFDIINNGLSR